jgi:hypothetical protein
MVSELVPMSETLALIVMSRSTLMLHPPPLLHRQSLPPPLLASRFGMPSMGSLGL